MRRSGAAHFSASSGCRVSFASRSRTASEISEGSARARRGGRQQARQSGPGDAVLLALAGGNRAQHQRLVGADEGAARAAHIDLAQRGRGQKRKDVVDQIHALRHAGAQEAFARDAAIGVRPIRPLPERQQPRAHAPQQELAGKIQLLRAHAGIVIIGGHGWRRRGAASHAGSADIGGWGARGPALPVLVSAFLGEAVAAPRARSL